jgi:tubulin polyglutamylase TTLL6/13
MLDAALEPWLIEVNHSPSFNIDSPMDLATKEALITDTLALVRACIHGRVCVGGGG